MAEVKTAAQAAARWWAEAIGAPTFDTFGPTRREYLASKTGMPMVFAESLMGALAAKNPVSAEQGELFTVALEALIGSDQRDYGLALATDYHPDPMLADAAKAAGISPSRFPWKTCMWVRSDHVTVSAGYRAPTVLVWHAPDWVHPTCGSRAWDKEAQNTRDELCTLLRYHEGDHGAFAPDPARCRTCGGGYSEHYSEEAYADSNRHSFRHPEEN